MGDGVTYGGSCEMWGFGIRSGVACGDLGSVMGIWGRLWGAASLLGSAVGFIMGFWGHLWGLGSALKTEVGGGRGNSAGRRHLGIGSRHVEGGRRHLGIWRAVLEAETAILKSGAAILELEAPYWRRTPPS